VISETVDEPGVPAHIVFSRGSASSLDWATIERFASSVRFDLGRTLEEMFGPKREVPVG
jgi:hypothetical protein